MAGERLKKKLKYIAGLYNIIIEGYGILSSNGKRRADKPSCFSEKLFYG
jgi:hypothetical protein